MRFVYLVDGHLRGSPETGGKAYANAVPPAMFQAALQACDKALPLGAWYEPKAFGLNPEHDVPVLTTLASPAGRHVLESRRKDCLPTVLIDHPFNSANRNKAVRVCVSGITLRWRNGVPHRKNRVVQDWNIQPWMNDDNLALMHCPSAGNDKDPDQYGIYLKKDERTAIPEMAAVIAQLKREARLREGYTVNVRPWEAPGPRMTMEERIVQHRAVIGGNSAMLIDAWRLGRFAIVGNEEDRPLATVVGSYPVPALPLREALAQLENPQSLRVEREPFFEFLDNADVPFDHLDKPTLREMVDWQMTHLLS